MERTFEAFVQRYGAALGKANVEVSLIHGDNKTAEVIERMSVEGTRAYLTLYPPGSVGKDQMVPLCGIRYTSKEGERIAKLAIEEHRAGNDVRAMLDVAAYGHERRQFKIEAIQKELPGFDEVRKLDKNLKKHGASATFSSGGRSVTIGKEDPAKKIVRGAELVKKKTPKKKAGRPRKLVKKKTRSRR